MERHQRDDSKPYMNKDGEDWAGLQTTNLKMRNSWRSSFKQAAGPSNVAVEQPISWHLWNKGKN